MQVGQGIREGIFEQCMGKCFLRRKNTKKKQRSSSAEGMRTESKQTSSMAGFAGEQSYNHKRRTARRVLSLRVLETCNCAELGHQQETEQVKVRAGGRSCPLSWPLPAGGAGALCKYS